jgi:hypothetical protein
LRSSSRGFDQAEKNIAEALHSEDSRRRDAASVFVIRNSVRAKRRGWIASLAAAVDLTIAAGPQQEVVYSWRSGATAADEAKVARLVAEGEQVISIGWGGFNDNDLELIGATGKLFLCRVMATGAAMMSRGRSGDAGGADRVCARVG